MCLLQLVLYSTGRHISILRNSWTEAATLLQEDGYPHKPRWNVQRAPRPAPAVRCCSQRMVFLCTSSVKARRNLQTRSKWIQCTGKQRSLQATTWIWARVFTALNWQAHLFSAWRFAVIIFSLVWTGVGVYISYKRWSGDVRNIVFTAEFDGFFW